MDEQTTEPISYLDPEKEIYSRNRKRFLKLTKTALGVLFIVLVISAAVWLIQYQRLAAEKAQLKADQKAIEEKHQQFNNPK